MADRFPSLQAMDAGQSEARGEADLDALDTEGPSDFLARERAALGDDADQFSTPVDAAATVKDGGGGDDEDLLGITSGPAPSAGDMGEFESSFPAIDTSNEAVAPGGTITGSTSLAYGPSYATAAAEEQGEEADVIREWRQRRDLGLHHRDKVSSDRKAETVKAAQQSIDEFYQNYNNRKDKTVAQTRREADELLRNREDTTSGGTSWERIAKLVDLSGKGVGGGSAASNKAKFRELLLSLRKDENAPGAAGV